MRGHMDNQVDILIDTKAVYRQCLQVLKLHDGIHRAGQMTPLARALSLCTSGLGSSPDHAKFTAAEVVEAYNEGVEDCYESAVQIEVKYDIGVGISRAILDKLIKED